jgi:hypothetical protein
MLSSDSLHNKKIGIENALLFSKDKNDAGSKGDDDDDYQYVVEWVSSFLGSLRSW